jgi:hypothetical protein
MNWNKDKYSVVDIFLTAREDLLNPPKEFPPSRPFITAQINK